jgi:7-cyano-7-deazaguanine synthase
VETIGFDYGQRHRVELDCRHVVLRHLRTEFPRWAERLGSDTVVPLDVFRQVSDTALTRDVEITIGASGLPTTFVPGRNLLFFTVAGALAYRRGLKVLVGGMCETDYSGYPDCRDDTLKALQVALNLGMEKRFVIETPLMWLDKAATWRMAENLGGEAMVRLVTEHTHSCYKGDRTRRHEWGYGCDACPACELRSNGYHRYKSSKE